MENTLIGLSHYASKVFHLLSQRMLSQHRLQTTSSERAMHILSNKKGQCIHYTISICVSSRKNTLYCGHLVYWIISLQVETSNLLALDTFWKLCLAPHHHHHTHIYLLVTHSLPFKDTLNDCPVTCVSWFSLKRICDKAKNVCWNR